MQVNHYTLELTVLDRVSSKTIVYARGVSPSFMKLDNIEDMRILKYFLQNHEYKEEELTKGFLKLQNAIRKWLLYRKRAHSLLRKREVGLLSTEQFLIRMNRPLSDKA